MKTLTWTVISSSLIPSLLILPTSFAADYDDSFRQFQAQNKAYADHKLLTTIHPHTKATHFFADRGDVDGDGLDDVIFTIYKGNEKDQSTHRVVVLKGLKNNQYQTLLINRPMANSGDYLTFNINAGQSFSVSSNSGGFVLQDGPGSTRTVEFGLSGTTLPIKKLSYSSPWRIESAAPPHSYTYHLGKSCYVWEWEALEYNAELKLEDMVAKAETGKFSLKNTHKLLMSNDTDPFSTKDQHGVIPVVLDGKINTIPDQSPSRSWECY